MKLYVHPDYPRIPRGSTARRKLIADALREWRRQRKNNFDNARTHHFTLSLLPSEASAAVRPPEQA